MAILKPVGRGGGARTWSILVVGLIALGAIRWNAGRARRAPAPPSVEPGEAPCAPGTMSCSEPPVARPATVVLRASEVCPRLGYLCDELEESDELRVAHWGRDKPALRVHVTRPPGLDPERARELQRAAIRGLRSWQNRPFGLRIDAIAADVEYDVVLTWTESLSGRRLGRTDTRWVLQNGQAHFSVDRMVLATRTPDEGGSPTDRQVELTAAHEMGHALGLPHSSDPADLMYPENTATRLTGRDYRTVSALYELENGTLIRE